MNPASPRGRALGLVAVLVALALPSTSAELSTADDAAAQPLASHDGDAPHAANLTLTVETHGGAEEGAPTLRVMRFNLSDARQDARGDWTFDAAPEERHETEIRWTVVADEGDRTVYLGEAESPEGGRVEVRFVRHDR